MSLREVVPSRQTRVPPKLVSVIVKQTITVPTTDFVTPRIIGRSKWIYEIKKFNQNQCNVRRLV